MRINPTTSAEGSEIHELAARIQRELDERLPKVLADRGPELQSLFLEVGDSAYGALNTDLFAPVRAMLRESELVAKPRLPGSFQSSREWGNADESHQQRWMWSIILRSGGPAIGALAVGSHHSHLTFHVPRSPEVLGLRATTPAAIVKEMSGIKAEFGDAEEFRHWYARYLSEQA